MPTKNSLLTSLALALATSLRDLSKGRLNRELDSAGREKLENRLSLLSEKLVIGLKRDELVTELGDLELLLDKLGLTKNQLTELREAAANKNLLQLSATHEQPLLLNDRDVRKLLLELLSLPRIATLLPDLSEQSENSLLVKLRRLNNLSLQLTDKQRLLKHRDELLHELRSMSTALAELLDSGAELNALQRLALRSNLVLLRLRPRLDGAALQVPDCRVDAQEARLSSLQHPGINTGVTKTA